MSLFFNRVTLLEGEIEAMLDDIAKAALVFHAAIKEYLAGDLDKFCERLKRIDKLESGVDSKRREIRYKLYTKMLIPESRGDVLSLIENIDNVIDLTKEVLTQIDIEQPVVPEHLTADYLNLAEASMNAMDYTVMAARAFFKNIHLINDYINKTYFYEHEADVLEARIKRILFSLDDPKELAEKMQLRDFAVHIAAVSDEAESVCERLSVAAIKRTI